MKRKPKKPEIEYRYMIGDLTQENLGELIKHCDYKIDRYFELLNKKIGKLVSAEVRKIMKQRAK